jgi:hypothetical protein
MRPRQKPPKFCTECRQLLHSLGTFKEPGESSEQIDALVIELTEIIDLETESLVRGTIYIALFRPHF